MSSQVNMKPHPRDAIKAKLKQRLVSKPRHENPWLQKGALNAALDLDLCQEMRVFALHQTVQDQHSEYVPETISAGELRQFVRRYGPHVYVEEGAAFAHLFNGVTLAVYQTVEALYCSQMRRSSFTIWRILQQMARKAAQTEVPYEAVWTMCEYLAEKRSRLTEVSATYNLSPWWIIGVEPHVLVQDPPGVSYHPALICVVGTEPSRVLGFWIGQPQQMAEGCLLALYEALVSTRAPAQDGAGGVSWRLPARLLSSLPLDEGYQHACISLALEMESLGQRTSPLVGALRNGWERDLAQRVLTTQQLATFFDTYLAKQHGYGPLRTRREQDRRFQWHIGYNREPSWQFPALRSLLPHVPATIAADGRIPYEGLQ
jgi:hypothetical protein